MSVRMTFWSSCPTRTETLDLARWIDGAKPGTKELVRFSLSVTWIRASETDTKYLWDGKPFDDASGYNDYYGFLTSADPDEFRQVCDRMKLTPADRLTFVAVTTVTDQPVQILEEPIPGKRKGHYEHIETPGWFIGGEEIFRRVESFDWNAASPAWGPGAAAFGKREVLSLTTFSSKWAEADLQVARDRLEALAWQGMSREASK